MNKEELQKKYNELNDKCSTLQSDLRDFKQECVTKNAEIKELTDNTMKFYENLILHLTAKQVTISDKEGTKHLNWKCAKDAQRFPLGYTERLVR